jgi:hypothetical protein
MVITLDPALEAALNERARKQGVTPEALVVKALRERFLPPPPPPIEPRDEWERRLLSVASDCGVSLSNEDLSRENLYD